MLKSRPICTGVLLPGEHVTA